MMNRAVTSVLFCAVLCSCYASSVAYRDCGSTLSNVTEVSIPGCHEMDARCTLIPGVNMMLSIKFIPNVDISQVNVFAHGVVYHVSSPLPLDEHDVCKDPYSGIQCPLERGQEYNYMYMLSLHKKTPNYRLDLKWEFQDAEGEKIVCVIIPVQVRVVKD
ncbi:PREDICTED: protein NPC2 homolog [Dinoponera quadriceps]|uniref:Protein NPC2 homolog n=1 Tax=Dinoponera quadriceps TaxID=609295 RepID=A0A6P3XUT9_DINQU|nr:PREDICTED: protein NPC2 homolog [Dinoponera quadriceps]